MRGYNRFIRGIIFNYRGIISSYRGNCAYHIGGVRVERTPTLNVLFHRTPPKSEHLKGKSTTFKNNNVCKNSLIKNKGMFLLYVE